LYHSFGVWVKQIASQFVHFKTSFAQTFALATRSRLFAFEMRTIEAVQCSADHCLFFFQFGVVNHCRFPSSTYFARNSPLLLYDVSIADNDVIDKHFCRQNGGATQYSVVLPNANGSLLNNLREQLLSITNGQGGNLTSAAFLSGRQANNYMFIEFVIQARSDPEWHSYVVPVASAMRSNNNIVWASTASAGAYARFRITNTTLITGGMDSMNIREVWGICKIT